MTNADEPNDQACWDTVVYFARGGNYVKIGYTTDVRPRLVGRSSGLRSVPRLAVQRTATFMPISGSGRVVGEWFEATPFVLDFIDDLVGRAVA